MFADHGGAQRRIGPSARDNLGGRRCSTGLLPPLIFLLLLLPCGGSSCPSNTDGSRFESLWMVGPGTSSRRPPIAWCSSRRRPRRLSRYLILFCHRLELGQGTGFSRTRSTKTNRFFEKQLARLRRTKIETSRDANCGTLGRLDAEYAPRWDVWYMYTYTLGFR